jgi:hypothetical protein
MTQSTQLIHELLSALPSIKAVLTSSNPAQKSGLPSTKVPWQSQDLTQQFGHKLLGLLDALGRLRAVVVRPNGNPAEVQSVTRTVFSHLQDLEQIHLRMKEQIYPSLTVGSPPHRRFENWDRHLNPTDVWRDTSWAPSGLNVAERSGLGLTKQIGLPTSTKNERQRYTTSFQNFDQKTNQLFNILSTVLKNQKEEQSSIARKIL